MTCPVCKKSPVHANLCKDCFTYALEKKLRKTIRVEYPLTKKETVQCLDTRYTPVLEFMIQEIVSQLQVTVIITNDPKPAQKIITAYSAEEYAIVHLQKFLDTSLQKDQTAHPLSNCTNEELELYAKLKNIILTKPLITTPSTSLIDPIQEKYAQTYTSIKNSFKEINKKL